MNEQALLKKTITLARTGDKEAFENFYILTVQETSAKICLTVRSSKDADDLLVDTYVMLYRHRAELPPEKDVLEEWIDDEISQTAFKKYGIEIHDFRLDEEFISISEEWAATLWLRIEEMVKFKSAEPKEEKRFFSSGIYMSCKIILSILILLVTVFILYKGLGRLNNKGNSDRKSMAALVSQEETGISESEIMIDKDRLQPGWEQRDDGKLYYVKHDGILADKTLALGKQLLTFSDKGELTLIGNNQAVSETPFLSFDEGVRYEVREGDIFKKENIKSASETRVVMNGHVVQADVRCGFLWYICKYQVPNSEQARTAIYRADLNGENQEEVYTTDNTLKTEQFQLTAEWMYYISDGILLRKNLQTDSVESLAENVEYYFAWENTAYYMKERTLESVSQGIDYSGIKAGYKIEFLENGLVLFDDLGQMVLPDENGDKQVGDRIYSIIEGVITSAKPSVREDGGVIYYIDLAGSTNKIYSKNSLGTQGLIRQEGLSVDSLCIAGQWLYYSARIEEYGDEMESQIYRLNLQTMESETVGERFRGYVKNLYFFDNLQLIFGEYIPSVADPEDIHGQILSIAIGGETEIINEMGVRPTYEGSDMLEIIMADGNRLYCIYHECNYNSETGELELTSSQPLEIPLHIAGD